MDTLLRRRAMMMAGEPPVPPITPIYELASPTNTINYDTGVKLFDTPKSFTILCQARNNNYSWSSWSEGIFGVKAGTKNLLFKVGSIDNGKDMRSGEVNNTGNKYTALVLNSTPSDRYCVSLEERNNGALTRRFAITYDSTTRKVQAWSTNTRDDNHWYIVPAVVYDSTNLFFDIGGVEGTVSIFKVYDVILDSSTITAFLNET